MPMSGGSGGMDWMSMMGGAQGDEKAAAKNWWQQPATSTPAPDIAPLAMGQQQGMGMEDVPPGWGFLRAYLGK